MRILVSVVAACTLGIVLLSTGSVSAFEEEPTEDPVEDPVEEDDEFEDGDTGIIEDCEGEIYTSFEAVAEASLAKGMDFHEHHTDGKTYYMLHDEEEEEAGSTTRKK